MKVGAFDLMLEKHLFFIETRFERYIPIYK